ncbi:unnamed protein product [Phaedon cochleariae]|uniref:26S proteasome regulatory subunit Rpn7 N-terminal domain-containing protein n=1 Tax=Phaedon cochleariae TaxID=80249 RepID=A0A9N9SHS0_PHACE|nr:unnamed protein product [Phaedon cochleariae]
MTKIDHHEQTVPCFHLPDHGVIKTDSLTTKLRIVFDASMKTTSNISLNDTLKCDSTIILSWIDTELSSLKTFVAHRVTEIQRYTECYQWKHVNSQDNPARRTNMFEALVMSEMYIIVIVCKIGAKNDSLRTLAEAFELTVALGYKLDNVFHRIRIDFFFNDLISVGDHLRLAEFLIEEGANWHSRNCYKTYKALFALATRDFTTAADLMVGCISTFVCMEVISYEKFIRYWYTRYSSLEIEIES